jgi:hypothetical protein
MKQKALLPLVIVSLIAAVLSILISNSIFQTSAHNLKAPNIQVITADLPDVKNDSNYNAIFNQGALDATQPVQIGPSVNNAPFQGR